MYKETHSHAHLCTAHVHEHTDIYLHTDMNMHTHRHTNTCTLRCKHVHAYIRSNGYTYIHNVYADTHRYEHKAREEHENTNLKVLPTLTSAYKGRRIQRASPNLAP